MSHNQDQAPLPGPSPSLDRLVAAKMGREVKTIATNSSGQPIYRMSLELGDWKSWTGVPAYSTSIAAAWELVEHMRSRGYTFGMFECLDKGMGIWLVRFQYASSFDITRQSVQWTADTAPLAICRAILALPDFEVKE